MIRFVAPFAVAALIFSGGAEARGDSAILKRGKEIARVNCGGCHAIERKGESPNPKSPPFRTLAKRYPIANLEEALGEGIVVGHEGAEMPQFKLSTGQIESLLAYLNSIQR